MKSTDLKLNPLYVIVSLKKWTRLSEDAAVHRAVELN